MIDVELQLQLENKYSELVKEKFGEPFDQYDFGLLYLSNASYEKTNSLELQKFKYLFSLGGDALDYLWNAIVNKRYNNLNKDFQYGKKYFTKDERLFLKDIKNHLAFYRRVDKTRYWDVVSLNFNEDIPVGDYVLTVPTKRYDRIYNNYFLKNIDAFENYYGRDYDAEAIKRYARIIYHNLMFVIVEKKTRKFVGTISFSNREDIEGEYHIEYFVLNQYRRKGIAYQCVKTLIDALFKGRLFVYDEDTIRDCFYVKRKVEAKKIIGTAREDNIPSRNMLEKLGFRFISINEPDHLFHGERVNDYRFELVNPNDPKS